MVTTNTNNSEDMINNNNNNISTSPREKGTKDLEGGDIKKLDDFSISTKFMLSTFFGRPYEWIFMILFILFTIFLPLKIDNTVQWSWSAVFSPLFICMFPLVLGPITFDIFKSVNNHDYIKELTEVRFPCPFLFLVLIVPLQGSGKMNLKRLMVYTPIIASIVFISLLVEKLSNGNDSVVPWIGVFIPLFVISLYCIILSIFLLFINSKTRLDQFVLLISNLPTTVFIILLFIKIEKQIVTLNWYNVFTPLFIGEGIIIIYPILVLVTKKVFEMDLEDKTFLNLNSYLVPAIFICILFLAPLIISEVLLCQLLENNSSYPLSIIFIPIYFLEFMFACGCVFMNIAIQPDDDI